MGTKSVLWGIDLGTTNSAVAILRGNEVEVVTSKVGDKVTPSVVYFSEDEGGRVIGEVGERARRRRLNASGRVVSEFKRFMGNPEWSWSPSGIEHSESASELSARVIRELKNSLRAHQALPEMRAAIVTVPAAFETPQFEDTKRAATEAGIEGVELLPEPVAAALAYGYKADTAHNPIWLAYDLGGGTFDVALVRGESGIFSVIDHEGDPTLGGKNLDEAIVEGIMRPHPNLTPEQRALVVRGTREWGVFTHTAEQAKCVLSVDESVEVDVTIADDLVSMRLYADDVNRIQAKLFKRTLELSRRLLERNQLAPQDIEKVIMVGGPTHSPFLREMVHKGVEDPDGGKPIEGLGIALDCSVNPLTAVAEGAAVYAAGKQIELESLENEFSASGVRASVRVPPRVSEEDVLVAVVFESADDVDFEGWSAQIERLDAEGRIVWESSPVSVSDGRIATRLPLIEGHNEFRLRAADAKGEAQELGNDRFETLRSRVGVQGLRLPRGIGVAAHDGRTAWFFEKSAGLPAQKTRDFKTTVRVEKGSAENAVVIPIVAGVEAKASLNRVIGEIRLGPGDAAGCTVPESSAIEITVRISESEIVTAEADLPDYDITVTGSMRGAGALTPRPEGIRGELARVRRDLERFREVRFESREIDALLEDLESECTIESIEELLEQGIDADPAPWTAASDRLLEIARQLDPHYSTADLILGWRPHAEYCEENVRVGISIVNESHGHSAHWMREWNRLLSEYRNACTRRDFEAAEEMAFTLMPAHFGQSPILANRVGGGLVTRGTANHMEGGQAVTGDVR